MRAHFRQALDFCEDTKVNRPKAATCDAIDEQQVVFKFFQADCREQLATSSYRPVSVELDKLLKAQGREMATQDLAWQWFDEAQGVKMTGSKKERREAETVAAEFLRHVDGPL
jgi:hypothetical protein